MTARTTWQSSALPAVIVPAVVSAGLAAEARARLEHASYTRYRLLDRGSYDFLDAPPLPELLDALAGVTEAVTGRAARVDHARALRLRPGDYLLTRHDRVHEDRPIELVLDLSAEPVTDAAVHWRHRGQVFFQMPSTVGALAIVERGPTVTSNHGYVSKRSGNASLVRLVVLLRGS